MYVFRNESLKRVIKIIQCISLYETPSINLITFQVNFSVKN